MERITSERIRHAEQHAQTLLRSLEQLKEGSIGTLFNSDQTSGYMRESLPRKAKDYKKDKKYNIERSNGGVEEKIMCTCGNSAAQRCDTNKCVKCCVDPSCGAKNHVRRQIKNSDKRKKSNYYESDESSNSSDEDLPLANVKRKKLVSHGGSTRASQTSSPSSDDEWTPTSPKEKKRMRGRRGAGRDVQPSLHAAPPSSALSLSVRIPPVTPHTHGTSVSSRTHLNPPVLPSAKEQNSSSRQWFSAERRMPALTAMLPNSQKTRGSSQPISTSIRLPLVPSTRQHTQQCHILPSPHMPSLSASKSPLPSSKYNTHQIGGNCEKRTADSRKENNKEDNNILMFYVRYPYSQYCDQSRLVDLFRPYTSIRHIQWIDKRSAYVTISEDATFQTYDAIYLNLVMTSEYENNNSLYVCPFTDYIKKKNSIENIKCEKKEIM